MRTYERVAKQAEEKKTELIFAHIDVSKNGQGRTLVCGCDTLFNIPVRFYNFSPLSSAKQRAIIIRRRG